MGSDRGDEANDRGGGPGPRSPSREELAARARLLGYAPWPCQWCGNWSLRRAGACWRCDTCGNSTECDT